jgi:hypothetical protein
LAIKSVTQESWEKRPGDDAQNTQWGSATDAIVTRQIDGGTDLAVAKPGTRSTTIPYDHKVLGHIVGQGCPNLGTIELLSWYPLE